MIIYKITNTLNSKVYIGQTRKFLNLRKNQHISDLNVGKHCNKYLQHVYNKYGKDVFKFETIDIASSLNELNEKEVYWIKYYDSMNSEKGYNLSEGGDAPLMTDETRKQISKTLKGKFVGENHWCYGKTPTLETIEKRVAKMKGKKQSSEHIAKRVANQIGKKQSPEHTEKVRLANTGRKQSPEEIAKRVASNIGKKRTEEFKKGMSLLHTGRVHNEESRKNMSLAHIGNKNPKLAEFNKTRKGKPHSPEHVAKRKESFRLNRLKKLEALKAS